jgi:soluble cytochrome b562
MEQLYCAQEGAQSGELPKLVAGINTLKQWPPEHPLYGEAQRLMGEWSVQILEIARTKVKQSDLKGALAAVRQIPKTVPAYKDAQKSVARWQKYSKQATAIYAKAEAAMKQQQWEIASQQVVALADFERDYWQLEKGATALGQQIGAEKQARQVLAQAQKLAANPDSLQLGGAIVAAAQVPPTSYAAPEAKANLKQWSQKLLTLSMQKWQQSDPDGAVNLLKTVPPSIEAAEVRDVVRFGQAFALANGGATSRWMPSLAQMYGLMEAIGAIKQVPSSSPFYAQAQALTKNWQAQLQDLTQIQYAQFTASLGQHSAIQWAIGQANQVPMNHPRRLLSQTWVSQWQNELERIEDQPILDQAVALAKPGDVPALKRAIAQASQVRKGRTLRIPSQTLIANWQAQIERIEDQPILDRAWELAQSGDLSMAISVAQKVSPGRVLYQEAKALADRWQIQLIVQAQIAADRPILDRASSLADAGGLSAAIETAQQISPGRALYGEAQSAIARWQAERDRIWNRSLDDSSGSGNGEYDNRDENTWGDDNSGDSSSSSPSFEESPSDSLEPSPPDSFDTGLPSSIETVPAPDEPPPPAPSSDEAASPPTETTSESSPSSYDGYYDQRYYQNQNQ